MLSISNPQDFRSNIRSKLTPILEDEFLSTNLETGIYNSAIREATSKKIIKKWDNPYFSQLYLDKLRSVYLNLKHDELLKQIKNKEIAAESVAFMTHQEMQPEHWRELIQLKMKRDSAKFTNNIQSSTDMYVCRKCKSRRSSFYELQTRSADEPATIFVTCLDCGKMSKH